MGLAATLQLVLGFGLGYLIATVAESFFHRHIGHASPRTIRFWRRHRWFFAPFLRAYFSHRMVHHTWTYQTDFVTQFRDEAEKREVDQRTPADYRAYIHKHDYGNTLRGFSVVRFVLPTAPAIPAVWLLFDPWVALGSMAPILVVYPLMSRWFHPLFHLPHEVAVRRSSAVTRWLLGTKYMTASRRNHFIHHRHPSYNYNLLLGGDWLLGRYRSASEEERDEMRQIGIP